VCDGELAPRRPPAPPRVARRRVLGLLGGAAAVGVSGVTGVSRVGAAGAAGAVRAPARPRAVPVGYGLEIHAREEWGLFLPPVGPLVEEAPGDVRFLLVHHTASANAYEPDDVPGAIAAIRRLHVEDRGWNDVAYNFLVDRYGGVWEGRAGSLAGPVRGDATGGSQGFALLCCLIGEFTAEPPTFEAQAALAALLAWLADTYGIDTSPGATATFTSRGSSRWAAGTEVTTTTIAGHRDMSSTACPGDAYYPIVRDQLPAAVTGLREPSTTTTTATATSGPASTTSALAPTTTAADDVAAPPDGGEGGGDLATPTAVGGAAVGVAAVAGAALVLRRRRTGDPDPPG
jgi:hypothetical protein